MKIFKPKNLPNLNYAFENTLIHNKYDFNGQTMIHVKLGDYVIYPSAAGDIESGSICIGNLIRIKLNLSLTETINITQHNPEKNVLDGITIKILLSSKNKSQKNIISIHEEEIKEKIMSHFKNYYFSDNQSLLLNLNDNNLILHITTSKNGFINENTIMDIYSDDVTLNLVGSKLLKRDLFRDDYNFEDIGIGGLNNELIGVFRRALSTRAVKPSIVENLGIKHVKGILLYGPPGCGKTLFARKIGSMITDKEPKIVNGPEIMNKFVGQSEENIRNLFSDAKFDNDLNDVNASLHVIIFDEIDAICKSRGNSGAQAGVNDGVVNQLLSMIDGVNQLNNIFIIAMTNRKDLLDEALLRAGRIEVHIEVGLPDLKGREQIFRIHTNKMRINNMIDANIDIKKLAVLTDNYSGAEIESVVKNSGSIALHEQLTSNKKEIKDTDIIVKMEYFLKSIREIAPTFGNINKKVLSLLPDKYVQLSLSHTFCYDKVNEFMVKNRRIKTILICGENGTGKTALATKIAFDNNVKYTKIIRPIDMIFSDEHSKSHYISNEVTKSYISEKSLIVLDDVEICINYANFGNNVVFSNKLFQTLITLLKTEPTIKTHQLTLISTCSDPDFFDMISKYFDLTFKIDKISATNLNNVTSSLGYDPNFITNNTDVTIRELLNNL